jgi:hypothetical protein
MIESYSNLYIKENSLNSSNDSIYNQPNQPNHNKDNQPNHNKDNKDSLIKSDSLDLVNNATTGINIIDTDTDEKNQILNYKKIHNNYSNTVNKETGSSNSDIIVNKGPSSSNSDISESNNINDNNSNNNVNNDSNNNVNNDSNNGWDAEADKILEGWHTQLKLLSFIYQWILDRNLKKANRLHTISVSLSTFLGVFTSLKMWINSSQSYSFATDLIISLINFTIALITTISKKYIDDKMNDSLRTYIHNIDNFLGEITSEYFKIKKYRTKANVFFLKNNSMFTSLLSKAPNISISDMKHGMIEYEEYLKEEQKFFRKIL